MPGRRNLERELLKHAQLRATLQRRIFTDLQTWLPDKDVALIGWNAILEYLHNTLHLRRPNGGLLTLRIVNRWRNDHALPIVRGYHNPRFITPPLSTAFALTAWTLSQFSTALHPYRTFDNRQTKPTQGNIPAQFAA